MLLTGNNIECISRLALFVVLHLIPLHLPEDSTVMITIVASRVIAMVNVKVKVAHTRLPSVGFRS